MLTESPTPTELATAIKLLAANGLVFAKFPGSHTAALIDRVQLGRRRRVWQGMDRGRWLEPNSDAASRQKLGN